MGLVPKAIKEENKQIFGASLNLLLGFMVTLLLSNSIGNTSVHSWFRVPFIIYCLAIYVLLNFKAPGNPKKHVWQGMIIWFVDLSSPRKFLSIVGYAFKEAFS
jgi:hypothetical protein